MFGNDPIVQQAWEELRILLERGGRVTNKLQDYCYYKGPVF